MHFEVGLLTLKYLCWKGRKTMEKEKTWSAIGLLLGIIVVVVGIIFMATPAAEYGTNTPEYASFGADYYTYQYDATRDAAINVGVVAENLRAMSAKLALYAGFGFVVLGLLLCLHYGRKFALAAVEREPVENNPETVPEMDEIVLQKEDGAE